MNYKRLIDLRLFTLCMVVLLVGCENNQHETASPTVSFEPQPSPRPFEMTPTGLSSPTSPNNTATPMTTRVMPSPTVTLANSTPNDSLATPAPVYTEPDLYLTLEPFDLFVIAASIPDLDLSTTMGTSQLAAAFNLDLTTTTGLSQFVVLRNHLNGLGHAFEYASSPIVIATHPNITVDGFRNLMPTSGSFWQNATPAINVAETIRWQVPGCENELACAEGRFLYYLEEHPEGFQEGVVSMVVADGLMVASIGPDTKQNILSIVSAEYPEKASTELQGIQNGLRIFELMHETFDIPYDAMQIYSYDGLEGQYGRQDYWQTKYLAVYWGTNGELIMPTPIKGDLESYNDAILAYDIRINSMEEPFVFRRWRLSLSLTSSTPEPETEFEVDLPPCPEPCSRSLFEDDDFRTKYYEVRGTPYEPIQIETANGIDNNELQWAIAYLTDQPLSLDN